MDKFVKTALVILFLAIGITEFCIIYTRANDNHRIYQLEETTKFQQNEIDKLKFALECINKKDS